MHTVVILMLTLLVGCAPTENSGDISSGFSGAADDGILLVDALGRELQLDEPASRVITVAPGATEIVYAAGGFERLIGVSAVDDYPPEIRDLERFSVLPMDFEAIAQLNPDLILASAQVNDPRDVILFDELSIPVFYLAASSWTEVNASIGNAGILLGTESEAVAAQTELTQQMDSLQSLTSPVERKPGGIFLISDITSYSFGAGSYVQDLFEQAGIEFLTAQFDNAAPVLSDEWILITDPEYIFGTFGSEFEPHDLLEHHPSWSSLQAVRNGRIYSIEQNLISRPGPRNVEAAFEMARRVHPNLFETDSNLN